MELVKKKYHKTKDNKKQFESSFNNVKFVRKVISTTGNYEGIIEGP